MTVELTEDQALIHTPGELSAVLRWLASADLEEVYVQPVGLRAIYDRYHSAAPVGGGEPVR